MSFVVSIPNELRDDVERRADLVDLIDEILETDDAVSTKVVFDLLVVVNRLSFAGDLRVAFLEDQLRNDLAGRIPNRSQENGEPRSCRQASVRLLTRRSHSSQLS